MISCGRSGEMGADLHRNEARAACATANLKPDGMIWKTVETARSSRPEKLVLLILQ